MATEPLTVFQTYRAASRRAQNRDNNRLELENIGSLFSVSLLGPKGNGPDCWLYTPELDQGFCITKIVSAPDAWRRCPQVLCIRGST